jgi:hypothetical protein
MGRGRRVEKFEELVTAVYEFEAWLDDRERMSAFGEDVKIGISPFAKLEAISAVYFPRFIKKIEALAAAAKNYQAWMGGAGYRRTSGKDAAAINAGLLEVYNPYLERRNELL